MSIDKKKSKDTKTNGFDNNSNSAKNGKTMHLIKSNGTNYVYEWVHSMIFAIAIVVVLLTFFVRLVDVKGPSMLQTLKSGDKVIITNFMYTPKDGDIVVISHGAQYADPIIKRVIATEGQTLDIDFEKQTVTVDGKVIDEPYTQGQTLDKGGVIPKVIPEGKVFVMGDNRTVSLDSRSTTIGLIDEMDIIGKAQLVVFPFNDAKTLF
ncbi:MAG: signal peptidase I [Oscillospiraceae bacterium]|nr:signal peptidase I [Oscillospiraceae bacterium]